MERGQLFRVIIVIILVNHEIARLISEYSESEIMWIPGDDTLCIVNIYDFSIDEIHGIFGEDPQQF